MQTRRFFKSMALVALVNGVLALLVAEEAAAQTKVADAKRYTDQLKTAKDSKKKIEALDELGKLGQVMKALVEPAIPLMFDNLKDKDAGVRASAARALGLSNADPAKSVPALVDLLKAEKDDNVKIGIAQGLAALGSEAKAARTPLQDVLKAADKKSKLGKEVQTALKSISGAKK